MCSRVINGGKGDLLKKKKYDYVMEIYLKMVLDCEVYY